MQPSGEQIEIAHGDQRAVVVEVGGGLRAYSVAGRDVLDGYADDEVCPSGRGQVLMPWPNRIEDGVYEFNGVCHQLAIDEPEKNNAIHGLVRWAGWTVVEREPHRVVVRHRLHARPGYPFSLALEIEYRLSDEGLSVRTTATNIGTGTCPFGTGAHPYLRVGTPTVDPALLHAPARTVLQANERAIPVGELAVDGTEYDFREPRPIGTTRLDHCFTDLERDGEGIASVTLQDPGGTRMSLWVDESYPYLMLFTGDPLPDVSRRAIAIEPMTCPPNAFRTGKDLTHLAAGQSMSHLWGIHHPR
jgi:aldose 1-epimerase